MARRDLAKREAQTPIYVEDRYGGGYGYGRDWSGIAKMFGLLLLAGVGGVVFVHAYWGPKGVQYFGYIVGGALVIFAVWAMMMQNFSMFSRHTRDIVRSTTEALIDVQQSDDKGEMGRIIAALQSSNHDSSMLARRILNTAKQIADEQKGVNGGTVPSIQDLIASQFGSGGDLQDREEDDDEIV